MSFKLSNDLLREKSLYNDEALVVKVRSGTSLRETGAEQIDAISLKISFRKNKEQQVSVEERTSHRTETELGICYRLNFEGDLPSRRITARCHNLETYVETHVYLFSKITV